ncbi:MAG: hypothetical protein KME27_29655 [Lyngbya sp. HA4199-MV5]|jgi:phosphate transport system substrate-binding protein|nr:hypothetical protein [Lyngbya sp. HA4199-MV5]
MPQKNETPALILAFLVTAGFIGGGLWWFRQADTGLNRLDDLKPTASVPPVASPSPSLSATLDGANQPSPAGDRAVDYSQLNHLRQSRRLIIC